MIKDVIIPSQEMFAISVKVGLRSFKIEQYISLAQYWYLRLQPLPVGQLTYNGMSCREVV